MTDSPPPPQNFRYTRLKVRRDLRLRELDARDFHPAIRLAHEAVGVPLQQREVFDFCLVYFFAASGVCHVNGVDYPFTPRTLLVEPPFQPCHFEIPPSMSTRHIAVHFDVREGFPDRKLFREREPYKIRLTSDLEIPVAAVFSDKHPLPRLLLQLVDAWQRQDTAGRLQANALLSHVLLEAFHFARMERRPAGPSRVHASVIRAMRYIEEHFAEPLSPDGIARAVGYSAHYLNQMFRRDMGASAMSCLATIRMRRATELLRDAQYSIKEVARMSGYRDARHFSHAFQDIHGLRPAQWRQPKL